MLSSSFRKHPLMSILPSTAEPPRSLYRKNPAGDTQKSPPRNPSGDRAGRLRATLAPPHRRLALPPLALSLTKCMLLSLLLGWANAPDPKDHNHNEEAGPSFIASNKWSGSKKGYVFHMGPQGLGYYCDSPPSEAVQEAAPQPTADQPVYRGKCSKSKCLGKMYQPTQKGTKICTTCKSHWELYPPLIKSEECRMCRGTALPLNWKRRKENAPCQACAATGREKEPFVKFEVSMETLWQENFRKCLQCGGRGEISKTVYYTYGEPPQSKRPPGFCPGCSRKCLKCNGLGFKNCVICKGMGWDYKPDPDKPADACRKCNRTGIMCMYGPHYASRQTNKTTSGNCNSSLNCKQRTCEQCDGKGKLAGTGFYAA